jgi:hypothetical protein
MMDWGAGKPAPAPGMNLALDNPSRSNEFHNLTPLVNRETNVRSGAKAISES